MAFKGNDDFQSKDDLTITIPSQFQLEELIRLGECKYNPLIYSMCSLAVLVEISYLLVTGINGGCSQGTFRRIANYANGWFLWRFLGEVGSFMLF